MKSNKELLKDLQGKKIKSRKINFEFSSNRTDYKKFILNNGKLNIQKD